jgi:ComF family protein
MELSGIHRTDVNSSLLVKLTGNMKIRFINDIFQGISSLLFPVTCIVCKRRINETQSLVCESCWRNLSYLSSDIIESKPVPDNIDMMIPVFVFDELVQTIIHFLKYNGFKSLGIELGKKVSLKVQNQIPVSNETVLIPVPLHPVKYRERGYNQSYYIAIGIGEILGLSIHRRLLKRIKNTETQTQLSANERQQNMQDAFEIADGVDLSGIHCAVLIDDVFTTGSTLNSAAGVLKKRGVEKVIGITVAAPI